MKKNVTPGLFGALLTIFFLSIITNGCEDRATNRVGTMVVNVASARKVLLDEVAKEVKVVSLQLPAEVFLGEIGSVREAGEYIVLHDSQRTHALTVIKKNGEYVSQLNSVGRGPGEYYQASAFALLEDGTLVMVNDRGVQHLIYTFPEFELIKRIEDQKYFMAMEHSGQQVFTVSDSPLDGNRYTGAELYDIEQNVYHGLNLPDKPSIIDLSYQNTISLHNEGLYYCSPGHLTTVFNITENGAHEFLKIDFGDHKLSAEAWDGDDPLKFEAEFFGSPKATWVQLFRSEGTYAHFFFMVSPDARRYLASCHLDSKGCEVYSSILLSETSGGLPHPLGMVDDFYAVLLHPWEVKELLRGNSGHKPWHRQLQKAGETEAPVLLLFRI